MRQKEQLTRDGIAVYCFAYRYAAYRMTYARGLVWDEIRPRLAEFEDHDILDLLTTSMDAKVTFIELSKKTNTCLCDIQELTGIIRYLEKVLEERKKANS